MPEDEIEDLRQVMIEQQVRRVPVVDVDGMLVGIVAQADIAREDGAASDREVGRIVEAISEPRSDLPWPLADGVGAGPHPLMVFIPASWYRSPAAAPFGATSSICSRSAGVSSISRDRMFSSR